MTSTSQTEEAPAEAPARPARVRPVALSKPLVITGMILATAMPALESTVVGTAMPTIVGVLQGLPLYPLVLVSYLLTSTTTVPVFGKLSDMYGRKPVFMAGTAIFVVGSLLCGLAWDMWSLIAFRAVQGVGAGAVLPITLTLVGDLFDLEERARLSGVFGSVWGISSMVGPVVGGTIVYLFDWRWVFFITVPVGIVSALLLWFYLREPPIHTRQKVDIAGAVTLTFGAGAALVALQLGGSIGWFTPATLALWGGAVVLMAAFIFFEQRAPAPILSIGVLSRPPILYACLAGFFAGSVIIGYAAYVPPLAQGSWGGTPAEAGLLIAPLSIGWPIASALTGRLLRNYSYHKLVREGLFTIVVGCLMLLPVQTELFAENGVLRVGLVLLSSFTAGVGLGISTTSMLIAVQTSVAWGERGIATAVVQFFRNMGNAVAASALGLVLTATLTPALHTPRVEAAVAQIPASARELISDPVYGPVNVLLDPDARKLLPPETTQTLAGVLANSLVWVFVGIVVMAGIGAVLGLRFPREVVSAE